ncbi:RadC family protein [Govanella unica]|uniref:DNA repair protein RadC n=1 Tax=Govanella unica TaxID=2975056 RepID=A0A9X3U0J6_9PROT|nr:DNA repair protein RadC [Govania unica]MDA5194812.1 DNA repair protein RadC [Govania unica]
MSVRVDSLSISALSSPNNERSDIKSWPKTENNTPHLTRKRKEVKCSGSRPNRARDFQKNTWHIPTYRERLRDRFLTQSRAILTQYELLELLISITDPKSDIKAMTTELCKKFGSLGSILSAPRKRLAEIPGINDDIMAAFQIIKATAIELQREEIMDQPVISSWKALIGYCRSAMAHEHEEQLRILFLNKNNMLMLDEVQSYGTVDQTPFYTREVIKRTLEIGATAIIVVHNHPSGDPTPSKEDVEITRKLKEAAAKLDIAVHDHLIIAKSGHASFKTLGLL